MRVEEEKDAQVLAYACTHFKDAAALDGIDHKLGPRISELWRLVVQLVGPISDRTGLQGDAELRKAFGCDVEVPTLKTFEPHLIVRYLSGCIRYFTLVSEAIDNVEKGLSEDRKSCAARLVVELVTEVSAWSERDDARTRRALAWKVDENTPVDWVRYSVLSAPAVVSGVLAEATELEPDERLLGMALLTALAVPASA